MKLFRMPPATVSLKELVQEFPKLTLPELRAEVLNSWPPPHQFKGVACLLLPPLLGVKLYKGYYYEAQLSRHRTKQRRLICILTPLIFENDSLFRRELKPSHRHPQESCSWQEKELSWLG